MTTETPKSPTTSPGTEVREKTDSSLKNERTKVDDSLAEEDKLGEARADDKLASVRAGADQDQLEARNARDIAKKEIRATPDLDIVAERKLDDKSIKVERKRADKAQKQERDIADAFQAREKKRLRLAAEVLLAVERKATDKDLLDERNQADREAQLASDSLSGEVGAHGVTKNFMAIVSHDLRNPLGAIYMATEILLTNLESTNINAPEAIQMAGIVHRNVVAMERLISDLLDVERIATGKIEMNPSKQSVNELFEESKDIFKLVAAKKSIQFDATIKSPVPVFGFFDRDRIRQVLSNLIGNALRHTADGGSVSLSARVLDSKIEISVSDTGSGIPEAEQLRIFEKFSQVGRVSRQGLGLGLYITKWIIEAHGGQISVKSKLGKGSVFKFSISARPY